MHQTHMFPYALKAGNWQS